VPPVTTTTLLSNLCAIVCLLRWRPFAVAQEMHPER
jgi:hypothetical protein